VILKLDIKKAFDKLEHKVIIDILWHKGFGPKWINWTNMIMNSGTSKILLNGVTGKQFHCKRGRGVRQGDPLSPLLFVVAADLLQTIINKVKDQVSSGCQYNRDVDNTSRSFNMRTTR
jgi:retron-type reverse transcriptase